MDVKLDGGAGYQVSHARIVKCVNVQALRPTISHLVHRQKRRRDQEEGSPSCLVEIEEG